MIEFILNGVQQQLEIESDTPLLWVVREEIGLTGSKFGCGKGLCGACTMHVDGVASRTCILPVSAVAGKSVTTIEGISEQAQHPVQQAWMEFNVPQCGYCQSGQIMSAIALLEQNPQPSDDDINQFMSGNICRCGTYPRIRQAIHWAAESLTKDETQTRVKKAGIGSASESS
ncbi:MAG: (2Fe-2S)-binding protein [Pseudomonadales bacterium]